MRPYLLLLAIGLFLCSYPGSAQLFSKTAKDMKKAEELIGKKQYEEALGVLNTVLDNSKGKDDYEVYYLKGFCAYKLGRYPAAIEQFNFALAKVNARQVLPPRTEQHFLDALLYRAYTFEELKDYPAAIRDLQLLTTSKGKPELRSLAYEKWARDFYETDRIAHQDKAELIVRKAVEVDPKNASAWAYQAELAMNERGYDEALPLLEKAVSLQADVFEKARYQSMLALCKYRLGKKEEALAIFKAAIDTAPESTKWRIYQQQANLVILHHLYDPALLAQAKVWANRAAILSEDCSNGITFAYMQALNNDLAGAQETLAPIGKCNNPLLRMSSDSLGAWVTDLSKAAKQNVKVKGYGSNSWYYWGEAKAGAAEGKGRAISRNFLYEVKDARFSKGELIAGTLTNRSEGWRYSGAFRNEQLNGNGTMEYPDGEKYTGTFSANQPQGKGKWLYANGDIYEGDVVASVPDGQGRFLSKDKTAYEGQFKAGKPHGKGFITVNGKREAAEFTDGQRTDAVFLARQKAERERLEAEKKAQEALAFQRIREEELAKAEKRKKTGKFIGKALALGGGAIALKQASDLGMSDADVTELGAALVSDVLTDGKSNALATTLTAKSASFNNTGGGALTNPLAGGGTAGGAAAGAGSGVGSTGKTAAECDCMKVAALQKYLNYKGPDGQLSALCGQKACYEWVLQCQYGGNNPKLVQQINDVKKVIASMGGDCSRL
ncbi:tetratricopeptide repeat protein [Flaviaesturariibacter flavus]|uniref:Tetratricopeptide repeat protein n=1 Tax=Flaviaesturariibacter flavus TaxID=2502780 RepID=A0A4R1B7T4_9BACT|nr:tetratricopeptide repeat protein [Flaviaesturariibacter flavus]TCJ12415.1 tetratricopeptide repeat protein [Flaviaesturariibacter flavus]